MPPTEQHCTLLAGASKTPTSTIFRGANLVGRCSPLSGSDPRHTVNLVVSHQPGHEESSQEDGSTGACPLRRSGLSIRNSVLFSKQLIR
jgi:hypothetical protein